MLALMLGFGQVRPCCRCAEQRYCGVALRLVGVGFATASALPQWPQTMYPARSSDRSGCGLCRVLCALLRAN
jgi:hypothetical protein